MRAAAQELTMEQMAEAPLVVYQAHLERGELCTGCSC
jgi:hypothetical protein